MQLSLSLQALVVEAYRTMADDAREELTRERFIAALCDPSVRFEVQKMSPRRLAEAEEIATRVEAANRQVRQDRGVRGVQSETDPVPDEVMRYVDKRLKQLHQESLKKTPNQVRWADAHEKISQVKCHECGRTGHYRPQCPRLMTNVRPGGETSR